MFVHDQAFEKIPRENKYFGQLMEAPSHKNMGIFRMSYPPNPPKRFLVSKAF